MKWILLFVCMAFNLYAKAGCFKEPALNEYFSGYYGNTCTQFPAKMDASIVPQWKGYLKISKGAEFSFYEEDFARIDPSFSGIDASQYSGVIKVFGKIWLPHLKQLNFAKVQRFDAKEGAFSAPKLWNLNTKTDKYFINNLEAPSLKSVFFLGDHIEGLQVRWPEVDLKIGWVKSLQDLNIEVERLAMYDYSGVRKSFRNTRISADKIIYVENGSFFGANNSIKTRNLVFKNVIFDDEISIDPHSELESLHLEEAALRLKSIPTTIQTLGIINSDISNLIFPERLNLKKFIFKGVSGDIATTLKIRSDMRVDISDVKLPFMNLEMIVGPELNMVKIVNSEFQKIKLDLNHSKNLEVVYLLNTEANNVELQHDQKASKLSPFFAMFVKTKKLAKNLRKQLGRSSVFFSDW